MKARFLAGLYALSEPRTVALVASLLFAALAAVAMLLPGGGGLLADPNSGGTGNG